MMVRGAVESALYRGSCLVVIVLLTQVGRGHAGVDYEDAFGQPPGWDQQDPQDVPRDPYPTADAPEGVAPTGGVPVTEVPPPASGEEIHPGNLTYNSSFLLNASMHFPHACALITTDVYMYERVRQLLDRRVKLIEYKLMMANYSNNPFYKNLSWTYNPDKWNRITSQHGQTLLSLAFNFGVLSLQTLTMGTVAMDVELYDDPPGCFNDLGEEQRVDTIVHLLVRDFRQGKDIVIEGDERVCHEIVVRQGVKGKFKDSCCHRHMISNRIKCATFVMNIWLSILHGVLLFVRFAILFVGPILFIPVIESLAMQNIPFVVKLKEPFLKTVCVVRSDTPVTYKYKHLLDFRSVKGMFKLRRSAASVPIAEPVKVKISQYDIMVDYNILLPENSVPVGLMQCLGRAIFSCKMSNVGPFKRCCQANMLSMFPNRAAVPWLNFWKNVGRILMIVLLPTPFYLRLLLYYFWELDELKNRKEALSRVGLTGTYESSLLHYLTPTHGFFIAMYVNYFVTALVLAYMANKEDNSMFMRIITGSFADLKAQSWIKVMGVTVSNMIWPFKRFGIIGCFIAPLYWPFALIFSLFFCAFLCLPTVYMTFRMLFYSKDAILNKIVKKPKTKGGYRVQEEGHDTTSLFELDALLAKHNLNNEVLDMDKIETASRASRRSRTSLSTVMTVIFENAGMKIRRVLEHLIASVLLILTMYSCLFLLSECIGCVVEIAVFTLMGLIVNAGSVLKYVMLILLIVVYSYDCFNNVPKKYLKLNKALFNEVKGRCKDLDKVTSLPSTLQENFGFKSQELSEQAEYESPDDVSDEQPRHWMINDLTLFVDNEDTPRIPRKLFEDVCQIRVSGAPGPVYQSLLEAGKQFLVILSFLFFVFLIVLSFGAIYQISSTNQMMATAAGGFLPMILRTFMAPVRPELEIGTVSFKSKLDEIIKNFFQIWPIFDLPFEVPTEEEIKEIEGGDEEESEEEEEEGEGDHEGATPAEGGVPGEVGAAGVVLPQAEPQSPLPPAIKQASFRLGPPPGKAVRLDPTLPTYEKVTEDALSQRVKDKNENTVRILEAPLDIPDYANRNMTREANPKGFIPEVELFNKWSTSAPESPGVTFAKDSMDGGGRSARSRGGGGSGGGGEAVEMKPMPNGQVVSDDTVEELDILIYLPEKYNDMWLDEWSDIAEYDTPPEDLEPEVFYEITETEPMAPLKDRETSNVHFG